MDNKELKQKLTEIINLHNSCDEIIALKKFKKEYKKSDFYKETHYSLKKLYSQEKISQSLNFESIFNNIKKEISELDTTKITEMFTSLDDETKQSFEDLKEKINNFNADIK